MLLYKKLCFLLLIGFNAVGQHPASFFTRAEAAAVKKDLLKYPLLRKSFIDIKTETDKWLGKNVDVPLPKDAAGGYTHDKHKQNYMLIFNSGVLYNLTGDVKYADLVKKVLLKYAGINAALPKHPQATSPFPGKIFWQSLNDANWLVYAGMAYDLTRNAMLPSERKLIEDKAFKPIVDFVTKDLESWFNLIYNHAVWACAGVGIVGIATDNKEYVDMALYGSKKDGKAGFIALMDGLFSPDGYYTEGPYYVRYALLPYFVFAAAINNARPELKIFEHRSKILQKAFEAALQQTNTDGTFFALNDALKEKDITANEIVTATNIAAAAYGVNEELKYVAGKQQEVLLNKGGLQLAKAIADNKNMPASFPYKTIEY
ncbi:MAG: heparinase, partial [Sphingobacteriales bacterium]